MPNVKKVLVVGATGLIGSSVMKHLSGQENVDVIALSRREPVQKYGAEFLSVDLTNRNECEKVFKKLTDVTHIVYAALYEKKQLTSGWLSQDQITINKEMLQNILEPLESSSMKTLKHITLLQGTKAYGGHVRPFKIPAREGESDARDIPNFYWEQEKYIKKMQGGKTWNWTIMRPQIVIGEAVGSAMNIIPAIGVYGALLREEGKPLYYPGKDTALIQAVDADLLAKAIDWAGDSELAKCNTFNVTNGDVLNLENAWETIAKVLGMDPGKQVPLSLDKEMANRTLDWDRIRNKYHLKSPGLSEFVGQSFQFADRYLTDLDYPLLVSTIKLRQAGFYEVIDSEVMFKKWFRIFQEKGLLPPP